jgi:predicted dehydrogenase
VSSLRIGVLGLGKMGRHHVRCAASAEGVVLAAACDVDPERAAGLPEGIPFTADPDELLDRCDAVVLAVPTDLHGALGRRVLEAGRHLLVEKPLAADADACRGLVATAERVGRVLGVGHVERWNGAMEAVRDRVGRPRFIEGHRLAEFDPRGTEVDVVLDLMIHDLDLVLQVYGEAPERVEAVGVPVISDRVDIANARLEFGHGELVNLTASRVSRDPVRKLRLFQEETYLSVDLRAQRAEVYFREPRAPGGFARDVVTAPEGHNPLVRELEAFAAACRGEPSRLAGPEEGTRAVELAGRILASLTERSARWSGTAAGKGASWADARS